MKMWLILPKHKKNERGYFTSDENGFFSYSWEKSSVNRWWMSLVHFDDIVCFRSSRSLISIEVTMYAGISLKLPCFLVHCLSPATRTQALKGRDLVYYYIQVSYTLRLSVNILGWVSRRIDGWWMMENLHRLTALSGECKEASSACRGLPAKPSPNYIAQNVVKSDSPVFESQIHHLPACDLEKGT